MTDPVEFSKRRVLVNSASSLATQFLNLTVLVWLHAYLVRRIDADEYSNYFLVTAIMAFAPILSAILTGGLSRFLMEAYARGDERRIREITSTLFPVVFATGLLLMTLAGVSSLWVDRVFTVVPGRESEAGLMLLLTIGGFSLSLMLAPFGSGLFVRQEFVLGNMIQLGSEVLRIAILLGLLFFVSTRVLWVVVAQVASQVVSLVAVVILSMRRVPAMRFRRDAIRWEQAGELALFGSWMLVWNVANRMSATMGIFVLNKLGLLAQANFFAFASLPFRRIQLLEDVASQPLMPVVTAMHALDQHERLRTVYVRGGRWALWLSMALIVPLVVYRSEVIDLWLGSEFSEVAVVMALLLVSLPIQYGHVMLGKVAIARNQVRTWALRAVAIQIVSLALTVFFASALGMGAVGAGLAYLTGTMIGETTLMVPLGLRLADVEFARWLRETVWSGLLPSLGGGLVWLGLRMTLQPDGPVALAGCVLGGLTVYGLLLLGLAWIGQDRQDLEALLGLGRRFLGRASSRSSS